MGIPASVDDASGVPSGESDWMGVEACRRGGDPVGTMPPLGIMRPAVLEPGLVNQLVFG